jgi:intergrase/recombinase
MDMRFCRKLSASWLHHCNIPIEIIDALQGRVPKSIFVKHYLVPQATFKSDVLNTVSEFAKKLTLIP